MGSRVRRTVGTAVALALACAAVPAGARQAARAAPPRAEAPQAAGAARRQPPARAAVLIRAIGSLDLSRAQRRAIRAVRDRNDVRIRDLGRRFLDGRRQIDELLFADAPAIDRARALSRDLATTSGERATARTLIELELFQVLTPTQRAELRRKREDARDARGRGAGVRQAPPSEPEDAEAADEPDDAADVPAPAPRRRPKAVRPRDLLARMALTPDQQVRLRQLRRQRAPVMRDLAIRFRAAQRAVDDALLADQLDAPLVRRLAEELGHVEAEREAARFETAAAVRELLTPAQATLFRESRRGPSSE